MSSEEILQRLHDAGVDSWEGYEHALGLLDVTDVDDPEAVLEALEASGVESWEGYETALED